LIDVRNADEFAKFSLPGAINIPLESIMNEENIDLLNQDVKTNIFYSNGSLQANEAWMLTRQLGYKNNYVLMGGLNYWVESIMNPQKPSSVSSDEEMAKYNYQKAAGRALGSDPSAINSDSSSVIQTNTVKSTVPKTESKKKKKVSGGCS
jgi:rhodanese-related sulfurtransferase